MRTWMKNQYSESQQIPKKSKSDRDITALLVNTEAQDGKVNALAKVVQSDRNMSKRGYVSLQRNNPENKIKS